MKTSTFSMYALHSFTDPVVLSVRPAEGTHLEGELYRYTLRNPSHFIYLYDCLQRGEQRGMEPAEALGLREHCDLNAAR